MKSFLDTDQYTSTRNNTYTGQPQRQWLEYADGVFEPVRKNGNLNKKYHGNKRELDWWTVDKPLDWDPVKEGKQVTLDHDYRRPGTERKTRPDNISAIGKPGEGKEGQHRTMELRPEDMEKAGAKLLPFRRGDKSKPVLFAAAGEKKKPGQENKAAPERSDTPANPEKSGEEKRPAPKTTLLRGAEAYHEFEAGRQAEKDAKAGESPQPTPGGSGKLAGADAVPAPKANNDDGKSDSAAAGAGVAGGMVKPKGQHGRGSASGHDERIAQFKEQYESADPTKKTKLKEEFNAEIDELKKQAKKAKGKERMKLLRRAQQWKGALKVLTDGKIRPIGPVMLFNVPLMERMLEGPIDPTFTDKT